MLPHGFNRNVRKIIATLAFPMYVVILMGRQSCHCLDVNSNPNPDCPKCLGTGHRIKIQEICGALEPNEPATRATQQNDRVVSNFYYFDASITPQEAIKPFNIIVRDHEADILQVPRIYRSDSNESIYYYVEGVKKKLYLEPFFKNFYGIVGDAK